MSRSEQRRLQRFEDAVIAAGLENGRADFERDITGDHYIDPFVHWLWLGWQARDTEVQLLSDLLMETADELEAEIKHRHGFDPETGEVKGVARKYELDMYTVRIARVVASDGEDPRIDHS